VENIRVVSEPRENHEGAKYVNDALALYNVAVTGHSYYSPLAIFLRDDRDAILGGAVGHVWGGWLDLSLLWVTEPLRGQGYGRKLVEAAEDEARSHGCRGVHLTTFSFQGRPFYEHLGYETIAEIPDYPPGHAHYTLKKLLA
jgi:GNAT superfamily N-acetyltransferase